jgi:large subunit ribosomal protein L22
MAEAIAISKNLRVSPKKVRLVAENLSGKPAQEVLDSLRFVPKKAAVPITKVLKSAVANAKNNKQLKPEGLVIKEILVDAGPTLKRIRPVSRGGAHQILKRTSHIKVILEEK